MLRPRKVKTHLSSFPGFIAIHYQELFVNLQAVLKSHFALLSGASELRVHRRARYDVSSGVFTVQIEEDTWILVGIASIENEVVARNTCTTTRDVKLNTRGIELSPAAWVHVKCRVRLVQADDFLADCITTFCQHFVDTKQEMRDQYTDLYTFQP